MLKVKTLPWMDNDQNLANQFVTVDLFEGFIGKQDTFRILFLECQLGRLLCPLFHLSFYKFSKNQLEKIDVGAHQDQCALKHVIGVLGHLIQWGKTQGQANFYESD